MKVTAKIKLDLQSQNYGSSVCAVQGDGGSRCVEAALLDGGKPWSVPAGVTAAVAYKKPDFTKGLYDKLADGTPAVTVRGSTVTVVLAKQMLTVPGSVQACIVFNNAALDQLTTFPFTVAVAANPVIGAEPSDDYIRLQWLEEKLDEYLEKFAGGVTDEAVVQRIVDEYLAANPPAVTETDPTVPAWAKQPTKPTYTAAEVGALPDTYTPPIATETTLGGVKAAAATEDMTQPVGITADGKLVTVPSPDSGGNADHVSVEPADDDVPKVFLTGSEFGNMTTSKNEVNMGLEYISKTDKFSAAIKIKFQGNSSLDYPKKNFTIKMYTDDSYEDKLKKSFRDWNHSGNKYVLKANYIDHAHARNIISANLWSEVVASRPDYDTLPVEMRNSPRNGAIDGFPVKLYVNGTYQGIYTWNIGKDDWMWCMDEDNANHVLMCAETNDNGSKNSTPCNFRALWSGTDENHWTVEVGTNSTAVKTALNNLIQFVMNNDGEDFRNGIGEYLDIQSAIDYYIFMYDVCGLDGLAKNMLLATYDGRLWRCGAYDMDSTFGLFWNGSKFVAATYRCPEDYQETNSLLWERIEANFLPELKARQAELRKTVLSYANIITHFERFMDVIGLDLYAEDLTIYTGIPSGSTNNIKQIRNYVRDRQAYVDAEFAAMALPVPCTGITLNANTLTFTAEGSQTLTATVTPDGCTDTVTWESDNTSIATVVDGVVVAVANGSATITAYCGDYSASCSVAVSGIAETVNCTGITLDKTELTFEGEGTQTITATVTPSDTTDSVVWVSSAPTVASITVEGNTCTVRGVNNGYAVITVTCGEYSANCSVTVSGIVAAQLYPFETGVVQLTNNEGTVVSVLTVENGNHINVIRSASGYVHVALTELPESPCNQSNIGVQHVMNREALFGLKTGDIVRTVVTYTESNTFDKDMSIFVVQANSNSTVNLCPNTKGNVDNTITISQDMDVAAICCWFNNSNATIDCDVKIYVNDVLYVGYFNNPYVGNYLEPEWSDTAEYSINSGEVVSGKTNYVTPELVELPDPASIVRISSELYTWVGVCLYDESGAFIAYKEANNGGKVLLATLPDNAKYARFSGFPATADCTDPASQINIQWY